DANVGNAGNGNRAVGEWRDRGQGGHRVGNVAHIELAADKLPRSGEGDEVLLKLDAAPHSSQHFGSEPEVALRGTAAKPGDCDDLAGDRRGCQEVRSRGRVWFNGVLGRLVRLGPYLELIASSPYVSAEGAHHCDGQVDVGRRHQIGHRYPQSLRSQRSKQAERGKELA